VNSWKNYSRLVGFAAAGWLGPQISFGMEKEMQAPVKQVVVVRRSNQVIPATNTRRVNLRVYILGDEPKLVDGNPVRPALLISPTASPRSVATPAVMRRSHPAEVSGHRHGWR